MNQRQRVGDTPKAVVIDLPYRVARNVRAEQARHGETQAELAKLLDLAQQAVSARLRGSTPFTLRDLDILARHWGMKATDLIDGNPSPPPGPDGGIYFHGNTFSHTQDRHRRKPVAA